MDKEKHKFQTLIDIGMALTQEKRLKDLLGKIVRYARELTAADAGSLYIKQGDSLRFEVSQNATLAQRRRRTSNVIIGKNIPISSRSIAGHVAMTGKILNFPDVYHLEGVEVTFDTSFDVINDYTTRSMLVVPMKNTSGDIIGVLQLINAMDDDKTIIPFKGEDEQIIMALGSQAAVAIQNVRLNDNLKSSYHEMISRLGLAAEYRDKETGNHIKRMSEYSRIIAQHLMLNEETIELIHFAAPMHDIGKVGIPDAILLKPGPLTPEEREVMKTHTVIGSRILSNSSVYLLQVAERISASHHERWDGKGYPHQIKGDEIPLEGRIVALADVFDALSSKRCYKEAWPLNKVLAIIEEERGAQFDNTVVTAFMDGIHEIMEVFNVYREV